MRKTAALAHYAALAGQGCAGLPRARWPGRFTEHGYRDPLVPESRDLRRFPFRFSGWVTAAPGSVRARGQAFFGFDNGAGVLGDQPTQHGVGVLDVAPLTGAVQDVQAGHGQAGRVADVVQPRGGFQEIGVCAENGRQAASSCAHVLDVRLAAGEDSWRTACIPVSPAQRIPRGLVKLETLPPGERPQITLRTPEGRSQDAVVVLVYSNVYNRSA